MRFETRDLAALILATGVAVAVIALAIGAAVHPSYISISSAALLGTVLGTLVGGLATFLGFRAGKDYYNSNNTVPPWVTPPPVPPGPPSVRPQ
jgi:hypothetical protein